MACGPGFGDELHSLRWWAARRFGGERGGFGRHGRGGGGRPWWVDAMGEAPPRAERGGVRYLVLEAIEAQPRHGYEIIQHIEQRAGGAYRPSPGVIYPTLQLLEELQLASIQEADGKKSYAITEAGKADLEANRGAVRDFYERFEEDSWEATGEELRELARFFGRMMRSVKLRVKRGHIPPAAMRTIRAALEEALRKIEDAFDQPSR
jgi:DNA-binding PadR family transcriptional regulator